MKVSFHLLLHFSGPLPLSLHNHQQQQQQHNWRFYLENKRGGKRKTKNRPNELKRDEIPRRYQPLNVLKNRRALRNGCPHRYFLSGRWNTKNNTRPPFCLVSRRSARPLRHLVGSNQIRLEFGFLP